MTFGIAAIGVGFGALYPNFNYDNAAEIPTSFGGAVCMIVSIGFIARHRHDRSLADLPDSRSASLRRGPVIAPTLWIVAPSLWRIVAALTAAAGSRFLASSGLGGCEQSED